LFIGDSLLEDNAKANVCENAGCISHDIIHVVLPVWEESLYITIVTTKPCDGIVKSEKTQTKSKRKAKVSKVK
ncbi:MAG: hypothetical protein KDE47_15995, partial [Caldilineaceae bacterium]|nr:hypothetical protein [Caldilineaceae bacterium]